MIEDIASTAARLLGGVYGPMAAILAVLVMAVALVLVKRFGGQIRWPKMPPVSPDPQDIQSPPIPLNPDGSIPVANPREPPDPGPM